MNYTIKINNSKFLGDKSKIYGLLSFQKRSYSNIFNKGKYFSLDNLFKSMFPVFSKDYKIKLEYLNYIKKDPVFNFSQCKKLLITNSSKIFLKIKILLASNKNRTNYEELKVKNFYICDIPLMTKNCSFLINGIERTLVSKTSIAPGIYFGKEKKINYVKIIPIRGVRIKLLFDSNNNIYYILDRGKKNKINNLLKIFNLNLKDIFLNYFNGSLLLIKNGKIFISVEKINNFVIEEKNYKFIKYINKNFIRIKKFKLLKKVKFLKETILFNKKFKQNFKINKKFLKFIKNKKNINDIYTLEIFNIYHFNQKCSKRNVTKKDEIFLFKNYDLSKKGRIKINNKIGLLNNKNYNLDSETIILILKRLIERNNFKFYIDDIDNIKNKRLVCSGEMIINSIMSGLNYICKNIRERIQNNNLNNSNFDFLNFKIVNSSIKDLFCSSSLSQFLEQTNLLSEITHKRRISFISGKKIRVSYDMRDVHYSFYGKICPIETPEGPNIGLVNSLAIFSKVDEFGFIRPYFYNKNKNKLEVISYSKENKSIISNSNLIRTKFNKNVTYARKKNKNLICDYNKTKYNDFSSIQTISVASSLIPFLEHNDANRTLMGSNMQRQALPCLVKNTPLVRTGLEEIISNNLNKNIISKKKSLVIYVDSKYLVSFYKNRYFIYKYPKNKKTNQNTSISYMPNKKIGDIIKKGEIISENSNTKDNVLSLGQNLFVAFMPWRGYNYEDSIIISERVLRKDLFTSLNIENIEIPINKNNDEIITSNVPGINSYQKKTLKDGVIKLGSYIKPGDIIVGKIKMDNKNLIPEEKLLNIIFDKKKKINMYDSSYRTPDGIWGIVTKINFVTKNVCVKNCYNNNNFKNISLKEIFLKIETKEDVCFINKREEIEKIVITITSKRKLKIGDKMSGRHGNKGVLAKILPEEKMPFMEDGTVCDIILNPLSVPARMNIGQIFEVNLGWIVWGIKERLKFHFRNKEFFEIKKILYFFIKKNMLKEKILKKFVKNNNLTKLINNLLKKICFETMPFEGASEADLNEINKFIFKKKYFKYITFNKERNKVKLIDGITGEMIENYITVGYMYYLKLYHTVDSKIHSRSIGPYSLVTQQPLRGKSNFGGQRLGEMEVWAIEAYGAAHLLFEMMTVKSDDIKGRNIMYRKIIKGNNENFKYNSPESFNALIKEINSLGIYVKFIK